MKRGFAAKLGAVLMMAGLLVTSTGCNELFYASNSVSFVAGWLLGNATAPTIVEQVCYQNGVLIDCADLPEDLGQ